MRLACSLSIILLVAAARADVHDPAADLQDESAISEEKNAELSFIDEVTVVEQRNVSQLRADLAQADDQLFSIYNALNTDDSLDMICKKETRIGSQIKYRVCKSSYHRQIEGEAGSDFLEGNGVSTASNVPDSHYDSVRSNMANLMAEHPELQQAVYKRAILRKRISEQKGNEYE